MNFDSFIWFDLILILFYVVSYSLELYGVHTSNLQNMVYGGECNVGTINCSFLELFGRPLTTNELYSFFHLAGYLVVGFGETMVGLQYLSVAKKYNHTVFSWNKWWQWNFMMMIYVLCPFCPPKPISKHLSFENPHLYPSFQIKFQFVWPATVFSHKFFTFLCCFSLSLPVFRHVNAMNCWFTKSICPSETVMYTYPSICPWKTLLPHLECWCVSLMCLVWKEYSHYWQIQFSWIWGKFLLLLLMY